MSIEGLLLLVLGGGPALAQDEGAEPAEADETDEAGEEEDWKKAIDLPARIAKLREAGVPPEEIAKALDGVKKGGMRPDHASEAMEAAGRSVEEHGTVDNFGGFVKSRVDEGMRGKDLAEAIRAEHEAHGKGRPEDAKGGDHDEHGMRGREDHDDHEGHDRDDDDDDHEDDDDHGKRGDAERGEHGKADRDDHRGKSDEHDRSEKGGRGGDR